MRIFSRWMPPLRDDRYGPWTIREWIGFAIITGVILALISLCIWRLVELRWTAGVILLPLALWMAFAIWSGNRADRAVAQTRQGEDIGTFARDINRHSAPFDPWVVRAVWDAFSPYAGFPLRATDRLDDFGIDSLELIELVLEVAERSGHSQKNMHEFWDDDLTLGDLVTFVSSQPKRPPGL